MRVLVTGGAGFIGSHVVDAFVGAGHEVAVVDSLTSGYRENLHPKARFFELDIRDPSLADVFSAFNPEVISHHAAQMDVRRSTQEPLYDADVNIRGSIHLLQLAIKHQTRKVIYISTGGAVYGEPEYNPVDEGHAVNPLCEYGASKHTVEHYLYMYAFNYGLDYTVLRYPNVYGPRQDPHGEAGVVAIFAGKMLAGEPCTINGDGTQERDFVAVGDCARANLLVAGEAGSRRIYNLGWGQPTNINQIFDALKRLTHYPLAANYGPPKLGETYKIYLDARRAAAEIDWRPAIGLDEGLANTVAFFKEHPERARR